MKPKYIKVPGPYPFDYDVLVKNNWFNRYRGYASFRQDANEHRILRKIKESQ
jgi:hypothetical protein